MKLVEAETPQALFFAGEARKNRPIKARFPKRLFPLDPGADRRCAHAATACNVNDHAAGRGTGSADFLGFTEDICHG
jgi:hypothetical protein